MYQLKNSHKPQVKKIQKSFKSFGELGKKIQQQVFAGGHFAIGEK